MKNLVAFALLLTTTLAQANTPVIESHTVEITSQKSMGNNVAGVGSGAGRQFNPDPVPSVKDRLQTAGDVVRTARDLVALGEAVYNLIQKGKPTNTTQYAPISVVPKIPGTDTAVDPLDLEGSSFPEVKSYVTTIKSGGKEVVRFEYQVRFAHSASYNGSGKYIQMAEIVPVSVKTSFGWDVNASMKIGGIMNHGSKTAPVAGTMITIKYQMNSWASAFEKNDSFHLTGNGDFRAY
jgi:hypothetical protein